MPGTFKFSALERRLIVFFTMVLILSGVALYYILDNARGSALVTFKNDILSSTLKIQQTYLNEYFSNVETTFNELYEQVNYKDVQAFSNLPKYTAQWDPKRKLYGKFVYIFFANESGHIHVSPYWEPKDPTYDPRKRPWYIPAIKEPGVNHWLTYHEANSNEQMYALSKAVVDSSGVPVGVFSMDLGVEAISGVLTKIGVNGKLALYVLDKHGTTIASRNAGKHELPAFSELDFRLNNADNIIFDRAVGGFWGRIPLNTTGWSIYVHADSTVIDEQSRTFFMSLMLFVLLIVSMSFLGGYITLRKVRHETRLMHEAIVTVTSDDDVPLPKIDDDNLYLNIHRKVLEQSTMLRKTKDIAEHDALTEALSRRRYDKDILSKTSTGEWITHVFFDVNKFKQINDTYGHAVGDDVLKLFASRIMLNIRESDHFYRYGGDEFVLICPERDIPKIEERLSLVLEGLTHEIRSKLGVEFSVSYGIATSDTASNVKEFIEQSDTVLFDRKLNA